MVIAIDGPSGAGKSTVAKALAKRFDLQYLDTGAMYRALAVKAREAGLTDDHPQEVAMLAASLVLVFDDQVLLLDGRDVSEEIRKPEIGNLASAISVHSEVRKQLVQLQQMLISEGGWTLEGRDTTTVVAHNADWKIYLDAASEVRARRRTDELLARGIPANYEKVLEEMRERDHRDMSRADSPLMVAPDATIVRTDDRTAEQVVEAIVSLVQSRGR